MLADHMAISTTAILSKRFIIIVAKLFLYSAERAVLSDRNHLPHSMEEMCGHDASTGDLCCHLAPPTFLDFAVTPSAWYR